MTFRFEHARGFLVCPKSRSELVQDAGALISTCPTARYSYPVVDEIPRLLIDEARELPLDEWQQIMERSGRSRETGLPT